MTAKVNEGSAEAQRFGLTATFLLGEMSGQGTVRVTQRITGAQPPQVFRTALERLFARRRATVPVK